MSGKKTTVIEIINGEEKKRDKIVLLLVTKRKKAMLQFERQWLLVGSSINVGGVAKAGIGWVYQLPCRSNIKTENIMTIVETI